MYRYSPQFILLFGNYTWLAINQNQYPHVQINCITKNITPTNNLRYFCHFFSSQFHFQREWCIIIALLWGLLFFKYFNVWMYDKCTTEIRYFSSVSKTTFLKRMFSVHLLFFSVTFADFSGRWSQCSNGKNVLSSRNVDNACDISCRA